MGPQPIGARQTHFILAEFASLGYLELLERAASYIAGFVVKLWSVLQDLDQVVDLYDRRWATSIGLPVPTQPSLAPIQ
ncbi:MAG: type IV secretory system conjugative DNA transfer family protein [Pseudomonadota bacterium]